MRSSLPPLILIFLELASSNTRAAVTPSQYEVPTEVGALLHSHNDFAQKRPLDLALENQYRSVEVDVTDRWGEIRVTHLGIFTDGTLKEMYLDRLQKLVNEKGSVYGDGKRFYLWVELRLFVTTGAIVGMLRDLLPRYPMLAQFGKDGREVTPGPVELILINRPPFLDKYFEGSDVMPACRGGSGVTTVLTEGKLLPFQRWAYVHWSSFFTWNGETKIPPDQEEKLRSFQTRAHAARLRTRFWGAPDHESLWKQIGNLPFDLVGTDHLAEAMAAVRTQSRPKNP